MEAVPEWHDDPPDDRIVPNPCLTLSEIVNAHGALRMFIAEHRPNGDVVLESAVERMRLAAKLHAEQYPAQWDAVVAETDMQARLFSYPGHRD